MAIAIIREDGRYTGVNGQITRATGTQSLTATELIVLDDRTPLIEVFRRPGGKYSADYVLLDRGVALIAFTLYEENDPHYVMVTPDDHGFLGASVQTLISAGFYRVPDLEAIEEGIIDHWHTNTAQQNRIRLRELKLL